MNATLTISATEAPVITIPEREEIQTVSDPLPRGELCAASNPEDADIVLHYKYTTDAVGGLYYFLTYDGHFIKSFSHQGMAFACFNACAKSWKRDYRRLLPAVMRIYMERHSNELEPLDTQVDEVLDLAIAANRAWRRG